MRLKQWIIAFISASTSSGFRLPNSGPTLPGRRHDGLTAGNGGTDDAANQNARCQVEITYVTLERRVATTAVPCATTFSGLIRACEKTTAARMQIPIQTLAITQGGDVIDADTAADLAIGSTPVALCCSSADTADELIGYARMMLSQKTAEHEAEREREVDMLEQELDYVRDQLLPPDL